MEKLVTIKSDEYTIIPIEYNLMRSRDVYWVGDGFIGLTQFKDILKKCGRWKSNIVLDFTDIGLVEDRMFQLLNDFSKIKQIHLVGISDNEQLYLRLKADLTIRFYEAKNGWIVFDKGLCDKCETVNINEVKTKYISRLVLQYTADMKNTAKKGIWDYIVSSGVYSDHYIDLKKLYYNVDETLFIIYMLYGQIKNWGEEYDYIVTTSKNGVAIGGILSEIVGKEMLCFNIGQMFEEIYNFSPQIKADKRYVHIFDMICLGNEIKNVDALISAQGGKLVKSFGIVCMQDLEAVKKYNRYSVLNRVKALVNYKDMNLEYSISLKEKGR